MGAARPVVPLGNVAAPAVLAARRRAEQVRQLDATTLTGCLAVYEAMRAGGARSADTIAGYQYAVRVAVAVVGDQPDLLTVSLLTPHLLEHGNPVTGRPMAPGTVNHVLRSLRAVTSTARKVKPEADALDRLLRAVDFVPEDKRIARAPPPDTLLRILPAARHPGEAAWLLLCARGAFRKGELRKLLPGDVDRARRWLYVAGRKNDADHVLDLSADPVTWEALEWALDHPDEMRPKMGPKVRATDGRVFPWSPAYLEKLLARCRAQLGDDADAYLPKGDAWHALRHLGATTVAEQTGSLTEVMALLGDSDPRRAAGYYRPQKARPAPVAATQEELRLPVYTAARRPGAAGEDARGHDHDHDTNRTNVRALRKGD